jgi:hypothetical protein
MNDVLVKCRCGLVQPITSLESQIRAFVIHWDEKADVAAGGYLEPWTVSRGISPLAPETRALYETTLYSN